MFEFKLCELKYMDTQQTFFQTVRNVGACRRGRFKIMF